MTPLCLPSMRRLIGMVPTIVALASATSAQPTFTIQLIKPLMPDAEIKYNEAFAINDAGTVVGTSGWVIPGSQGSNGFTFANGLVTALPAIPPSGSFFSPKAINNAGDIAGIGSLLPGSQPNKACVLTPGGTPTLYGPLPTFGFAAFTSINSLGHAVGFGGVNVAPYKYGAFTLESGALVALPALVPGQTRVIAESINDAGVIVGVSGNQSLLTQVPVAWVNGQAKALKMIPGMDNGWAGSVNRLGVIAGSQQFGSGGASHACLWNGPSAPAQSLGQIEGFRTVVTDINDAGWGLTAWVSDKAHFALYWNGAFHDITITNAFGWDGFWFHGLNNAGQIVGYGLYNGDQRACVLTPNVLLPLFSTHPTDASLCPGENAAFGVVAKGTGLTYQWRRDGVDLVNGPTGTGSTVTGAATANLQVSGIGPSDLGTYDCVVSNVSGDVPSNPAVLEIGSACDPCYADCDASGGLSIDDFICFQTLFALGDLGADCDASGVLSIDDFICFQTLFAIGC